jgi:rod shape-determining protein MreD
MAVVPPAIRAVPAVALTLLLALLSMRSFELSSLVTLQLLLVMHALYYWTVFRPSLFPAWAAFLLGFAIDLMAGRLLGLNAFLLVFATLVIMRQRRYLRSQPFATQWAGFLLVALGAEAIRWLVMGLVTMTMFSPASALASAVCSAALYPLTSLVMLGCLRLISPRDDGETLHG